MRLRMYVTLPDLASARQLANDLLLARIEDKHMHFLARRGTDLGELHEASYLQKSDAVHGATTGLVIGGVVGVLVGVLLVYFPPGGASIQLVAVLIAAIVGAALGVWIASMVSNISFICSTQESGTPAGREVSGRLADGLREAT